MPTIQTEFRIQLPGLQTPFVKRTQIEVDSIATHSFTVPGVPVAKPPAQPAAKKKGSAKRGIGKARKSRVKSEKRTLSIPHSDARFVAFFTQGDSSGFSVSVGGGKKEVSLAEPHVLTEAASARRAVQKSIVLHNASTAPRTLLVLVGSSLPNSKAHAVRGG
jgi:hypothetical protein